MTTSSARLQTRALLCACAFGALTAGAAHAQTAPAGQPQEAAKPAAPPPSASTGPALEEVVVTARKQQERLQDVPVTVTALTAQTIERLQTKNIFNLAQQTPGLYFGTSGGRNGGNKLQIRNFSTGTAGPSKASAFVDGIYIPGDYASIPLANLERIEVLKGPQSAYFGRATFVGAVNFVTRDPGNEFSGNIDLIGATEGEHDLTGYVSVPILKDKLSTQLTFREYSYEGPDERHTNDGYHLGDEGTRAISSKTVFKPTDDLTLKFNYSHVEDDDHIPATLYAPLNSRVPIARPGGTTGYYFNGATHIDFSAPNWGLPTTALTDPGIRHYANRYSFLYDWKVLGHTVSGFVSHGQERYKEQLDGNLYLSGTSPTVIPNALGVPTTATFASSFFNYNLSEKDTQAEIRLTSPQNQRLRYTVGYNYSDIRQRTEVGRDQAEIAARYGPMFPDSIKVKQQLAQLDAQITQEAHRIVSGLDSDARATAAQAAALRRQLDELKGEQASNARKSVEADSKQRESDALHATVTQISQLAQQAAQEQHLSDPQGRIVAFARPPARPSFPNRPLFSLLGLFGGLLAGTAAVLLLALLETRVRTREDITSGVGAVCLSAIPLLTKAQLRSAPGVAAAWDFVIAKPMSAFAESLRAIRSGLQLGPESLRVVAITSAEQGEGKSTCAVSLARVLAMSGDKVLLLDCDLRRRALSSLAAGARIGLAEVMAGSATLDHSLQEDRIRGLQLLTGGSGGFSPKDIFGGEAFKRLIADARSRFDYVILDTPPLFAVTDARIVCAAADATILMCRWGQTRRSAIQAALELLRQDGTHSAGVALTMVDVRAPDIARSQNPAAYFSGMPGYFQD